jgi:oligopeptide/dipeptide ABC transporter ATP-binding protein
VPRPTAPGRDTLQTISGLPPDLAHLPPGCSFAPRCFMATDECWAAVPQLEPTDEGRFSACFHRDKLRASASTAVTV